MPRSARISKESYKEENIFKKKLLQFVITM